VSGERSEVTAAVGASQHPEEALIVLKVMKAGVHPPLQLLLLLLLLLLRVFRVFWVLGFNPESLHLSAPHVSHLLLLLLLLLLLWTRRRGASRRRAAVPPRHGAPRLSAPISAAATTCSLDRSRHSGVSRPGEGAWPRGAQIKLPARR